jgi:excisionase family DNA binding protein
VSRPLRRAGQDGVGAIVELLTEIRDLLTEPAQPEEKKFYDVAEVADILGVSTMTVYREIQSGRFPAARFGHRLVIPAKALDQLEAEAFDGEGP